MHVIVARYNEDVSWLKNLLPRTPFTVYNKGADDIDIMYVKRPNVGREAETYLTHIIDNYDNLHGHYLFCQGDPIDHADTSIVGVESLGLNTGKGNMKDFIVFLNTYQPFHDFMAVGRWYCCDKQGRPHIVLNLEQEIHTLFKEADIPPLIWFISGAQFIVSAECIRMRPKSFYESLRKRGHSFEAGFEKYAHIMERMWPLIFNPNFKHNDAF